MQCEPGTENQGRDDDDGAERRILVFRHSNPPNLGPFPSHGGGKDYIARAKPKPPPGRHPSRGQNRRISVSALTLAMLLFCRVSVCFNLDAPQKTPTAPIGWLAGWFFWMPLFEFSVFGCAYQLICEKWLSAGPPPSRSSR